MLNINFNPFPVLETKRLVLRNLQESDKYDLFDIRSNSETMQYIPRPLAKTVNDAAEVIKMITGFTSSNERINWAITEKGEDKLIGVIGYVNFKQESFRAEVGYVLNNKYTRKGIAYEALEAVLDYGFNTVNLHSIEAIIRPENVASVRLVEKAGFIKEAYFRDYVFHNNRFYDELVYSLIRPDKYRVS
ncbi:MAG: GNAT family protein [Bacteroidia bacterium]|jgi:ribosomal-protein-alanine N-acetyltransferase